MKRHSAFALALSIAGADGLGVASREATPATARPKLTVIYLTN